MSVVQVTVAPVVVIPLVATAEIAGGGALETVTPTGAAVPTFPEASEARAVSVWLPLVAPVVSQPKVYGAAMSRGPRLAPSSWSWTQATPTLSLALAVTGTDGPETVEPAAGAVRAT